MDVVDRTSVREYTRPCREACLRVFDTNVPAFFRTHERAEFEAFLDDLPGPYYVLLDPEGDLVACGGYAVAPESGAADLCWGMVTQERHGQGLGRALTELRLERIREDGSARTVSLHTSQHTVGFYERLGFKTVRVTENGYASGLDRHDMVLEIHP